MTSLLVASETKSEVKHVEVRVDKAKQNSTSRFIAYLESFQAKTHPIFSSKTPP
jgi:hypothetical protein